MNRRAAAQFVDHSMNKLAQIPGATRKMDTFGIFNQLFFVGSALIAHSHMPAHHLHLPHQLNKDGLSCLLVEVPMLSMSRRLVQELFLVMVLAQQQLQVCLLYYVLSHP